MKTWMRRIRGAIGMGLTWAGVWFGAGIVLARIPGLPDSDLPFALLFAPLGFVTGAIFSGVIAITEGGDRTARLTLPRFAAWGALGGALLSGLFVAGAVLGGRNALAEFLLFGPALAAAGAISAAGSLALARRGGTQALGDGGDAAEAEGGPYLPNK